MGRPQDTISGDDLESARAEARVQLARRDECERIRAQHRVSSSPADDFAPEIQVARNAAQERALAKLQALSDQGCAFPGEDEDQAAHRILRTRGKGRAPSQRAIYGEEIDGRMAADKHGKRERAELARLDNVRSEFVAATNHASAVFRTTHERPNAGPRDLTAADLPVEKLRRIERKTLELQQAIPLDLDGPDFVITPVDPRRGGYAVETVPQTDESVSGYEPDL